MNARRLAWLLLQPVATLALVGLLAWMDPAWLDQRAWWRGPHATPDLVLRREPRALAGLVVPGTPARRLSTVEEEAGSAMVDPARASRLTAGLGMVLDLPAGALPERAAVTLAPVSLLPRDMAGPVTGPVVEVRVAGRDHVAFTRPATLELPYRRELFREGAPVMALFADGAWQLLPSRVDTGRAVVTAEVPRTAVLAVLNPALEGTVSGGLVAGTALAAAGYLLSSTEREQLWEGLYQASGCSGTRETTNFVLHWCTRGPQAAENGLPEELAGQLERAYAGLGAVGMKPDPPVLRKYHVFLGATPSYGATATGGPVFFNARLRELAAADAASPDDVLRAVTAHELVHLSQGRSFSTLGQHRFSWWLEMSAAYLADLSWDREGQPVDLVPARYLREARGRLPARPMDRAEDEEPHAFASFLRWLDTRKPGAGLAFVQAVDSRGEASLAVLDAVARESLGEGLGVLFTRWAQAFTHDDLWSGRLAPRMHRGPSPLSAALAHAAGDNGPAFAAVVLRTDDGGVVTPFAASTSLPLAPLTAAAFPMNTGPLDRRGLLVVRVRAEPGVPLETWIAAGRIGAARLPGQGANRGFRRFTEAATVVEDVGAGGVDHATLLVVNPSLEKSAGPVTIERWLLLPPETVVAEQKTPGAWTISWPRVALRDEAVFRGYTVYRRRAPAPDGAWTPVRAELREESFTDRPPAGAEWTYSVRVADVLGNESEPATATAGAGLAGTWSGSLRVTGGGGDAALLASLGLPDGARPPALLSRVGVPLALRLRPEAGGLTLRVTRLGTWSGEGRPVALGILGPRTAGRDGLRLRLTREDEIRQDGVVSWRLRRTDD